MHLRSHLYQTALGLLFITGATGVQALSCGSPRADNIVNGKNSPKTIVVGVPVSSRLANEAKASTQKEPPKIVGELKVVEVLRGKSAPLIPIEVDTPHRTWGSPGLHIGRPYLVLGNSDHIESFRIGLCVFPLTIDANDVTVGDGCKLYQIRELLNINQPRSRACEVLIRQQYRSANRTKAEREAMQEEFRRAKWQDLGVDWSG